MAVSAITGAGRSGSVFHRFGQLAREIWVKGDAGAPQPASLFGAVAATVGKLSWVIWAASIGLGFIQSFTYAEIAGLLAKVDGHSTAPKAVQEAPPSPRRLDFGISGIVVSPSSDRPDRAGVLGAAVSSESVAHRAGIITGDIICQVGARPTRSLADLETAVAAIPVHSSAAVRIYRGLKEVTLSARF